MNTELTNIITLTDDEQLTINNMSIETLVLLMDREDQQNKGHLEQDYSLCETLSDSSYILEEL